MNSDAPDTLVTHLTTSLSAMALLNSSCQGVVETYCAETSSEWYAEVSTELNAAQQLVRQWRLSGNLYFNQDIITRVVTTAGDITATQSTCNALFDDLEAHYDGHKKEKLIATLDTLAQPITAMQSTFQNYTQQLKLWSQQVESAKEALNATIGEIQQEEKNLENDIALTNQKISDLHKQIDDDRKAIANARAQEKRGIYETIFGVLLAPVTGGASLIIAGIGVCSIAEAESEVAVLEKSIRTEHNKIVEDQCHLSDDDKQVVSLKLLLISVETVLSDCTGIITAIEALETTVMSLKEELTNVAGTLAKAETSQEVIMQKVWYRTVCNEWQAIYDVARTLRTASPSTHHKTIG